MMERAMLMCRASSMSLVALVATSSGGGRAGARDIAFASKRDDNWEGSRRLPRSYFC
jgi:hypothetical protein